MLDVVFSATLRVPQNYPNIRTALAAAHARDTVLVADGTWTGVNNIGLTITANVTLKSVNGAAACIIDAENTDQSRGFTLSAGCVLAGFKMRRSKFEMLTATSINGFNINNCVIENCVPDSPHVVTAISGGRGVIEFCIFQNNHAEQAGGAITLTNNANLTLRSCYFTSNQSDISGGAIYITSGSDVVMRNCIFTGNRCFWYGGAVADTVLGSTADIMFCNFINNTTSAWGGGFYKDTNCDAVIVNSIFWGNTVQTENGSQIAAHLQNQNHRLNIHHCIVQGGEDQDAGWFGDNLITERPRFERGAHAPLWGPDSYFIIQNSSAIDAGSAAAADLGMDVFTTHRQAVPDQGIVDIGFHYDMILFHKLGRFTGTILDAANNIGLGGAEVLTSLGQRVLTNGSGVFNLADAIAETTFTATFRKSFYNDSCITDLFIAENETLVVNCALLHPEFTITPNSIQATVDSTIDRGIDTGFVDLTIANSGNGPLIWDSKIELVGDVNIDPWTRRQTLMVGEILGYDNSKRAKGVAFLNDKFYVNFRYGTSNDTNKVYVFSREGEVLDSFSQFSASQNGMTDAAWDGTLLWGCDGNMVYGYTPEGVLATSFIGPLNIGRYITYDPQRETLWIAFTTNDIMGVDRQGNPVEGSPLRRKGLRLYGVAYWQDDPQGYQLYIISQLSNDPIGYIYKMNIEDGDTLFVRSLSTPVGSPIMPEITCDMDPYTVSFICLCEGLQPEGGDRVLVYMLAGNTAWMMLDQTSGRIEGGNQTNLQMALYNQRFSIGSYHGQLTITHNAEGREIVMPITLTIRDGRLAPFTREFAPTEYSLQPAYPNPFNAEACLNYTLAAPGVVSLRVYDLAGREVATLVDEYQSAGQFNVSVDAGGWSAGIYLARLEAGGRCCTTKLVCLK